MLLPCLIVLDWLFGPSMFVDIVRKDEHTHPDEAGQHQQNIAQDGGSRRSIHSHSKVGRQVAETVTERLNFLTKMGRLFFANL